MAFKMLVKNTLTGACGLADVPCPPAALSALTPIEINGTVIQLNLIALMQAIGLKDCTGSQILGGASIATCANLNTAIAAITDNVVTGGSYDAAANTLILNRVTGGAVNISLTGLINDVIASIPPLVVNAPLTGNGVSTPLDINFAALAVADAAAIMTALNLRDCNNAVITQATTIATCANLTAAIAALPGDKFLQGLQSYNPATNTMTLLMSDGSTVAIDMTALLADVPPTAGFANGPITGNGLVGTPYDINFAALAPADSSNIMTALNLRNCAGVSHAVGAQVPSCAELTAATAVITAGKVSVFGNDSTTLLGYLLPV